MTESTNQLTITVVMATYNGSRYIEKQLLSILPFLGPNDEIIISDDGSTDSTLMVAREVLEGCSARYRVLDGPRSGVAANFAYAAGFASSDVILFADQDDIWYRDKIDSMRNAFASNAWAQVVYHNADSIDENDQLLSRGIISPALAKQGYWRCIVRSPFVGCCMGLRRPFFDSLADRIATSPAHDQFVGLIAKRQSAAHYLDCTLIAHRYHDNNVSKPLPLRSKIAFRLQMLQCTRKRTMPK